MNVALLWSLCELIISPPSTLVDEAPERMDALLTDLENSSNTCSETMYPVLSTLGAAVVSSTVEVDLVVRLFEFIST